MILTAKSMVAARRGSMGPKRGQQKPAWTYNRLGFFVIIAVTIAISAAGIAGVTAAIIRDQVATGIFGLVVAVAGIYVLLGSMRELARIDLLVDQFRSVSDPTRDELMAKLLDDNSLSIFRLVELLLGSLERILGGTGQQPQPGAAEPPAGKSPQAPEG